MELKDYQHEQDKQATYPGQGDNPGFMFAVAGLSAASGSVSEALLGLLKDGVTPDAQATIKREIGKALWYVSACATELGVSLEDVAEENLDLNNRR